mmetsp:Transcript_4958/g.8842  ORF Transcript_4958/g.8842 Transcript_4958/m.8842 type:complete len:205 (+) Transcript_4958:637-1251(+)
MRLISNGVSVVSFPEAAAAHSKLRPLKLENTFPSSSYPCTSTVSGSVSDKRRTVVMIAILSIGAAYTSTVTVSPVSTLIADTSQEDLVFAVTVRSADEDSMPGQESSSRTCATTTSSSDEIHSKHPGEALTFVDTAKLSRWLSVAALSVGKRRLTELTLIAASTPSSCATAQPRAAPASTLNPRTIAHSPLNALRLPHDHLATA